MSRNTKQEKIEIIRYETEEFANTNERIADILTDFNNEKAENSEVNNPNGFVIGQPIETTSSTVSLPLDASGKNSATFNGVTRTKMSGDLFNFTAVSAGKLKSLIVYAKPDAQIFYLAEGAEGTEAITPIYNGLFVAGITVSDSGEIIDSGTAKEFKQKADDGWKSTLLNSNSGVWLSLETPQSSFEILATGLVTIPTIKGILTKADKNIWNGKRILIRNNTGLDIITEVVDPLPVVTGSTYMSFAIINTLKKDIDHWFTIKSGKLEILKSGGGGSSFPQIGNNGDVFTKDSTAEEGGKWDGTLNKVLKHFIEPSGILPISTAAALGGYIRNVGTILVYPVVKYIQVNIPQGVISLNYKAARTLVGASDLNSYSSVLAKTNNGFVSLLGVVNEALTQFIYEETIILPSGTEYVLIGWSNDKSYVGQIPVLSFNLSPGALIVQEDSVKNYVDAETVNRSTADNLKLDKPTADGSWVVTKSGSSFTYTDASDFGKNISNADLSNISARIFTQGNEFTWNTAGFGYAIKNLGASNFDTHNSILSVDNAGNVAKVSSNNLNLDLANQFFNKNLQYFLVNLGSNTYTYFRVGDLTVEMFGNTSSQSPTLWMYYKSNGTRIATQGSRGLWIQSQVFKYIRKFSIDSTIRTQRMFVGLGNDFAFGPPTNTPITTLNITGIGMESESNKIYLVSNGTLVDSGYTNNPSNAYICTISRSLGSNDVTVKLDVYNDAGFIASVSHIFTSSSTNWAALFCYDSLGVDQVVLRDWGAVLESIDPLK